MFSFGTALAWIIISPLAFLIDILGVFVILHYRPFFHSCDVAFISLFVTMATNSWLLLPVPAVVRLGDIYWSKSLCAFYTWLSLTLRSAHLLVLLVLNVYWMASLRVSRKGQTFTSSKAMKISVCVCWFVSVTAGLVPVVGWTDIFDFYESGVCKFLPRNVSIGFAIAFVIASFVSLVMGLISTLDTYLVLKNMRGVALTKYHAGRFHISTVSGGEQASSRVHARYNDLNVSFELCRLVLCFSLASAALNVFPLLVSQFIQLLNQYDLETLETTLLWLLLVEALTLPHLLWLLSRRYRHAAVYSWRVFVIRDPLAREEDTEACILQSYRLNVKETSSRPYLNGGALSSEVNGSALGPGIEDHYSEVMPTLGRVDQRPNGLAHPPAGREGSTSSTAYSLVHPRAMSNGGVLCDDHDLRETHTQPEVQGQQHSNFHETSFSSSSPTTVAKFSSRVVVSDAEIHHNILRTFPSRPQPGVSSITKDNVPELFSGISRKDAGSIPPNGHEGTRPQRYNSRDASEVINGKLCSLSNDYTQSGDHILTPVKRNIENMMYMASTNHHNPSHRTQTMNNLNSSIMEVHNCPRTGPLPSKITTKSVLTLGVYYDDILITNSARNSAIQNLPVREISNPESSFNEFSQYGNDSRPYISKGNYRKFLPYTNMAVSDVDNTIDENCEDKATNSERRQDEGSKCDPENSLIFRLIQENNLNSQLPADTGNVTLEVSAEQNTEKVNVLQDDATQDYSKLENVSGSEMLHLKMKSVRAAMAIYRSDDTTSEEWDTDNTCDDDDNDGGELPDDIHRNVLSASSDIETSLVSTSNDQLSEYVHSSPTKADGDKIQEISSIKTVLQRVSIGDDQEMDPEPDAEIAQPDIKSLGLNHESSKTAESHNTAHSRVDHSAESYIITNSGHDQSNQSSSPAHKNKHRFENREFADISDELNLTTFHDSNTSSLSRVGQQNKDVLEDIAVISASLDTTCLSSEKPLVGEITKAAPASSRENNVNADELNLSTRAHNDKNHVSSITRSVKDASYSDHVIISDSETSENSGTSEIVETGSMESDRSVTIEPYGRRRPAWMDDSLLSSSGPSLVLQDWGSAGLVNENSYGKDTTAFRASTDEDRARMNDSRLSMDESRTSMDARMAPLNDEKKNNDSKNDLDFFKLNPRNTEPHISNKYLSPYVPVVPSGRYFFDEDIDRGFENALAIDYNVNSNRGVYFETIVEESEGSYSESPSSLVFPDIDEISVFKTQAITSGHSPRGRRGSFPASASTYSVVRDKKQQIRHADSLSSMNFPSSERTSADGSDDVSAPQASDRVEYTSGHLQQYTTLKVSSSLISDDINNISTAGRAGSSNPARTEFSDLPNSPWAVTETSGTEPALELSFDSDFSQFSSDNSLSNSWNCSSLSAKHGSSENDFVQEETEGRFVSSTPVDVRLYESSSSNMTAVYF